VCHSETVSIEGFTPVGVTLQRHRGQLNITVAKQSLYRFWVSDGPLLSKRYPGV
jgi:hypothetical protein